MFKRKIALDTSEWMVHKWISSVCSFYPGSPSGGTSESCCYSLDGDYHPKSLRGTFVLQLVPLVGGGNFNRLSLLGGSGALGYAFEEHLPSPNSPKQLGTGQVRLTSAAHRTSGKMAAQDGRYHSQDWVFQLFFPFFSFFTIQLIYQLSDSNSVKRKKRPSELSQITFLYASEIADLRNKLLRGAGCLSICWEILSWLFCTSSLSVTFVPAFSENVSRLMWNNHM